MKSKLKKLSLILLLLMVTIVTLSINYFSANEKNNFEEIAIINNNLLKFKSENEHAFKETYGENYKEALKKNESAVLVSAEIDSLFTNKKLNSVEYPDYFGGKYIDDDNNLVIQVLKNDSKTFEEEFVNLKNDVVIKYVNNSYSDLEEVNNQIINYFIKNGVLGTGLKANYIDVINNIVIVELENNTLEEQKWFKDNVVNSDVIKFVKNEKQVVDTKSHMAGGAGPNLCSIAYRVRRNGKDGFLTAAHCVTQGSTYGDYGTVVERRYGGQMDVAFIELLAGNSVSNNIRYGYSSTITLNTDSNTYPTVNTVGTLVAKSGIATGSTSGTISNTNFSYSNSSGVYFTNLVVTRAKCNNGDSGGLVFKPVNQTYGTAAGVIHAKLLPGGASPTEPGDTIYSKAEVIVNNLNVSRY